MANFTPHIVLAALGIAALIVGVLLWADREVDRIARERDNAIVSLVLEQSVERVAHAQETATVWDDAVLRMRQKPLDLDWIDGNLGIWLHDYAGFDEVYILSPSGQPIYAMRNGKRVMPETYIAVEAVADPIVARLRRTKNVVRSTGGDVAMLSPGRADFAILRGRPAVVSVKLIVSQSGKIAQTPGQEDVHVSVVFLDDNFFARLGSQYGLAHARYQIAPSRDLDDASVALRGAGGHTIGYLVWQPFAPGSQVTTVVAPILVLVLLLSIGVIYVLASRLAKRTFDLEESRLQAQHQAMHDGLTGLGNRAMFEMRLDEALARSRRLNTSLALLYVDLDRFKQINDTLGHPAGDALIRQVARRLVAEVRGYDFVSRLGGDEFAILINEPEDRAVIDRICSRIVAQLERPFNVSGSQAYIGASIGVAIAPEDGLDRAELTRKADIALYEAKAEGRSRYVLFTPSMDEDVRLREATDRELRQALADCDAQLRLHYQPIFSTSDGSLTGVEALLRWEHPENGLVTPDAFIRAAEESGLIEVLGQWVLRRAALDARNWPGLRVAVNVSPIQVRSHNFTETVREILAESGLEAERLEIEITETALMAASSEVAASLRELRQMGVACALDDFGTGYSSLSHIRDIAVDRIKIDRSFVQVVNTEAGAALVEAIVGLASANGLRLTAEGVENRDQYAFLGRVGCHEVQGYLFARPVPADQIARMLEEKLCVQPAQQNCDHPAAMI
ncbi:putative bifunctional diguanylate cyclase/phosphodiesterase [Novosphingobium mangrovi (ex Huang et al. 2023)]|uniref:EAL domain-containing protein n=1 Tax=Novosphingobium mangrovi (ex Huang et al. 2023) TaxID=2976432 RepID=A0ABT2I1Z3_9SPHN|nr:EAL domain-containing protein [Novosphingobium mangrovi (ex Huang et al. 2023)]MCT2398820.1 EAL domain-containing protein [Novosphingobium mangrovi (ex Huang et al. 2023)]